MSPKLGDLADIWSPSTTSEFRTKFPGHQQARGRTRIAYYCTGGLHFRSRFGGNREHTWSCWGQTKCASALVMTERHQCWVHLGAAVSDATVPNKGGAPVQLGTSIINGVVYGLPSLGCFSLFIGEEECFWNCCNSSHRAPDLTVRIRKRQPDVGSQSTGGPSTFVTCRGYLQFPVSTHAEPTRMWRWSRSSTSVSSLSDLRGNLIL